MSGRRKLSRQVDGQRGTDRRTTEGIDHKHDTESETIRQTDTQAEQTDRLTEQRA